MMVTKKVYLCATALFMILQIHAQDIEVKKFEPLEKDQTAALSPRKDINGVTCGLVKVLLKEPGAEFEGSVMGDVQFTGKEYLVYLPNGTKRLGIKHPDYLPTTIVFADYGTKKVASATTYELKVKTNKKQAKVDNSKKGMAVFNIKPSNAMLLIDGQIADGSGGAYTLSLPYGTHYYTVKLKDFSINNQVVQIDKNAKNINVDLTEYFANISINCQDNNAEIYVNGESKSTGNWKGLLVPGNCVIEIKRTGYHPLSKTIELAENDSVSLEFPSLKMISGILDVRYAPNGSEVYANGVKIGVTPLRKELPIGDYKVEIKKEGYLSFTNNIKMTDGKQMLEEGELEPTQLKKLFLDAESGNAYAQDCLAYFYKKGSDYVFEDDSYWEYADYAPDYDKAKKEGFKIEKDIPKCIEWQIKAASTFKSKGDNFSVYNNYMNIMELYIVGNDMKRDFKESFRWAKAAAELDYHSTGENYWWLAWHYFYGRGTEKNQRQALFWLNKLYDGKLNTINANILYSCADQLNYGIDMNDGSDSEELISSFMKKNHLE